MDFIFHLKANDHACFGGIVVRANVRYRKCFAVVVSPPIISQLYAPVCFYLSPRRHTPNDPFPFAPIFLQPFVHLLFVMSIHTHTHCRLLIIYYFFNTDCTCMCEASVDEGRVEDEAVMCSDNDPQELLTISRGYLHAIFISFSYCSLIQYGIC